MTILVYIAIVILTFLGVIYAPSSAHLVAVFVVVLCLLGFSYTAYARRYVWVTQYRACLYIAALALCVMSLRLCAYIEQLPEHLHNELLTLNVRVLQVSMEHQDTVAKRSKLLLKVLAPSQHDAADSAIVKLEGKRIEVMWYGQAPTVKIGEHWRIRLKLKQLRATHNKHAFDYELYQIRRGLYARGIIRDGALIQHVDDTLDIARNIDAHLRTDFAPTIYGLLCALLIGNTKHIDEATWELLRASGSVHLFVVSGLHLSILATLVYFVLKISLLYLPWRVAPSHQFYNALLSLAICFAYAQLTGFSLPVQRAFIMLACWFSKDIFGLQYSALLRFCVALLLVLLLDPIAVFFSSLYFSFGAVLFLLCVYVGCIHTPSITRAAWQTQCYLSFICLPLSFAVFGLASIASLFVNIVCIPILSIVLMPLLILYLGTLLLRIECQYLVDGISFIMRYFVQLADYSQGWVLESNAVDISTPELVLIAFAGLIYVCVKKRIYLLIYAVCLLCSLLPNKNKEMISLNVFDVGQGLSVTVHARDTHILYDVGNAYPSGFSFANSVLLPYFQAQNIAAIDYLIVSHDDADHAAGLDDIISAMRVDQAYFGDGKTLQKRNDDIHSAFLCQRQQLIHTAVLRINILYANPTAKESNNRSCVVLIRTPLMSVVLPGDISYAVEEDILLRHEVLGKLPGLVVLLAAHHGSKTSSHQQWIDSLDPDIVIFSAAYKHYFKHPHKEVVTRFQRQGALMFNTAASGQISLEFDRLGRWALKRSRYTQRLWWREKRETYAKMNKLEI